MVSLKILAKQIPLLILLVGVGFGAVLTGPISFEPTVTTPHKLVKKEAGLPVQLIIPKISVNAFLDYVSITPQGALGVPAGPADAAWYVNGPRPGDIGNSIIDGHYGYKDNIPAVFDNLSELQAGDSISVIDDRGVTVNFVVRQVEMYGESQSDKSILKSTDGKSHLVLITCEGVWSEAQQSYSNRLVVIADKEA